MEREKGKGGGAGREGGESRDSMLMGEGGRRRGRGGVGRERGGEGEREGGMKGERGEEEEVMSEVRREVTLFQTRRTRIWYQFFDCMSTIS